jgi:hypothetical protein
MGVNGFDERLEASRVARADMIHGLKTPELTDLERVRLSQLDEERGGVLTGLARRSRFVSPIVTGVALFSLLAAATRPVHADDVTLKDGRVLQNVLVLEPPGMGHTYRIYTAPTVFTDYTKDAVTRVDKKPAIIASNPITVPAGGSTIETTKYGASLAFPAAAQTQLPKGSEVTMPDGGGTLKVKGKASIRVPEASQVGLPKGASIQYENGITANLPADATVPLGPKDAATLQSPDAEAKVTFTGKATVTVDSPSTVTVPANAGVKAPGPARIDLPPDVRVTPSTELQPAPEAAPAPPAAAAPAPWTAPVDASIRIPKNGATVAIPNAIKVTVPGNSTITVPAGGAQLTVPPNSQVEVPKEETLRLPKNSTVTRGSGLRETVKADADVTVDKGDLVRLPPEDTQIQLPEGTRVTTHRSAAEMDLPAGVRIDVRGGAPMQVPKDAVVTPNPTPAAPTAAPPKAPAAVPLTKEAVYQRLDRALNDSAIVFKTNDVLIDFMIQQYKANPEVYDKDPQFWYRLGRLYSSVGMKQEYDAGDLNARKPTLVQARGCFNRASELLAAGGQPTSSLPRLDRWNFDDIIKFSDGDLKNLGFTPREISAMRPPDLLIK